MRIPALTLISAVMLALSAVAAERSAPTVQQILDRYVEASGGREALERLKTRVMKGRVEMTVLGTSGAFEVLSKAPNKQVSKTDLGGFGSMREGFDGMVAWSVAPLQGTRIKEGADLARIQRTTVFPRELKLREAYSRMEVKGAEKVNGVDVWVIEAFPRSGKPDRLFFDKKTGLLVREESVVPSMLGELSFQMDFGDYREVDGVKVPFSLRMVKPAALEITISEVKHNVDLSDKLFSKPED